MLACPGPFVPIPGAAVSEFGSRSWSPAPDGLNIEGANRVSQWPRYGETSPVGSRGHRLQVGPQGRADVPVDISIGDACLLHPGPVAVRRKPGQYLAASTTLCETRTPSRRRAGGDEMTGACESHSSNGRARRNHRHLTLRRKGSEERAEGSDLYRAVPIGTAVSLAREGTLWRCAMIAYANWRSVRSRR
jgi:hypothetical protein